MSDLIEQELDAEDRDDAREQLADAINKDRAMSEKPTQLAYVAQDSCLQLFVGTRRVGSIGSEPYWRKFSPEDEQRAKQVVASFNAVQSAAEKLGRDPVAYAEGLADGKLASAHSSFRRLIEAIDGGCLTDATLVQARAALSLLQGDS